MATTPFDERHPIYRENQAKWQYYADHYAGGPSYPLKANPLLSAMGLPGGAAPQSGSQRYGGAGSYVQRFPLEPEDAYLHRLARAVTINIVAPVVDLYCATVGKQENIMVNAPGLEPFLDDCDRQGQSLVQFLSGTRQHATVRGVTYLFVDSPQATDTITTQADVQRQGIRPYVVEILPEDLLNWRLDPLGQPLEILFRVQLEVAGSLLDSTENPHVTEELRYWSRSTWATYRKGADGKWAQANAGENKLGVVPIIPLYHKRLRPFEGESLIKDAARIQQLLTNWVSDFDQAIEKQMFAVPVLKSTKEPKEVGVGVSVCLHLNPEDKEEFSYVTPNTAPFEAGWDAFYRLVQLANKHMGLKASPIMTQDTKSESGVSKAWDFYEADKIMGQMALYEQETVKSALTFAALWQGTEFNGSVQYGTKYDLSTVTDDIEDLLSLQTAGCPPTVCREVLRRIIAKKLPSLPGDVQKTIDAELKKYGVAPEPSMGSAPPADPALVKDSATRQPALPAEQPGIV
jgi:hypothetical protein